MDRILKRESINTFSGNPITTLREAERTLKGSDWNPREKNDAPPVSRILRAEAQLVDDHDIEKQEARSGIRYGKLPVNSVDEIRRLHPYASTAELDELMRRYTS